MKKLQIALYWGAACGGCDVAVLDTNEFILDVAALADIRLWPIAVDGKYADVEALADNELDLTFFNGAVRNSENEHLAKLLRRKSKMLVAFGSCAHLGGIPGLANLTGREEILTKNYLHNPSIEPGNKKIPLPETDLNGQLLQLPYFFKRVYRLADIVPVDYCLPGCPPAPEQVKLSILALAGGKRPPPGSTIGAAERNLCDDCQRSKSEKKIKHFYRPHEILQDPDKCLLEQGILCMGPVTRSGCGVRCPDTGLGCRGCYGPAPDVMDQGSKFISALGSIIDSKDPHEIETIIAGIPDLTAILYRFGLPASFLQRSLKL
ncbi:MAG: oxidoreductase [Candidatus Aminicenantes bacterium]|nr:oxidoreductase [Candidatus Aminicenantes bacterium]